MRVLLTGAAGFVGYYVAARLRDDRATVVGLDALDDSVYLPPSSASAPPDSPIAPVT